MNTEGAFDPYGLPKEILSLPLPLIGIAGMDFSSKCHNSVWETFTMNRRADRIPLKFISIPEQVQFPEMKPKRQSYEWYIPKGILKSNWVQKYMDHVPALIVVFWNLDWNDSNWSEKKTQIALYIQTLKSSVGGRNIRIAVVLIQNCSGTYPGEDGGEASEKAALLCAACDLPPKHLFILPFSDSHLLGYTMRLENALSEIAGGFYLGEIKGIKAHRDFLNKTNHQLLFIRHQFKIAFHNELRSDPQNAIKHYSQCYHHLLEHRFTNTNLHEIRIVAAIVNYKMCKLNFALNLPRDAIEQFRRHIDVFRQRTGPKELIFEHYAWLSKQYQIFGEVFDEAVREGLPAVQTQHPGFYYQQAAQYAVLRRNTALQVCKDVSSPETKVLEDWDALEFYGQRPWRPGKHSLEPPESQSEAEGIKALRYNEVRVVNHSKLIIPQFSSAIAQFKKYRCPRIKRYLMVQMSKEYYEAQDPAKALALLNHVMWDYRSERWWALLSACSTLALACAYQIGSLQEYLTLCLEIMGPRVNCNQEEKSKAFCNLKKIIKCEAPNPPPDANPESVAMATELWVFNIQSSQASVSINMNDILSCLEIKAGFKEAVSSVDVPCPVVIKFRNHFNELLQLYYVILHTDSPMHPQLKETDPSKLSLAPNTFTDIPLVLHPHIQNVEKTVKITGVTAGLGTSEDKTVAMHWTGTGSNGVSIHAGNMSSSKEFGLRLPFPSVNEDIYPETNIISRKTKLEAKINHDEVALVWEWLPVVIELKNMESSTISDVMLSLTLKADSESNLCQTTQISTASSLENKLGSASISRCPIPNMATDEVAKHLFYIKALTAASRCFTLKISYKCAVDLEKRTVVCPTVFSSTFTTTAQMPFKVTVDTQSLHFSPISRVAHFERFLVVPKIKCTSHVAIEFAGSSIGVAKQVNLEGENQSQVAGVQLIENEEATDCFCVSIYNSDNFKSINTLGQYLLYWKRANKEESPVVSASFALPPIMADDWGIWVEADMPPQGIVRVPVTIAYEITNTGSFVQEISVNMHVSDGFMFSGHKEVRLRILPGMQECVTYTLYPLIAGYVQLPRLSVNIDSSNDSLDEFISRILPTHLFIMPQEKKGKENGSMLCVT